MPKLDGKTAVITGGTVGMALTTARLFAEEGAHVIVTGRRRDKLDEAVATIGRNATGIYMPGAHGASWPCSDATLDGCHRGFGPGRTDQGVNELGTGAGDPGGHPPLVVLMVVRGPDTESSRCGRFAKESRVCGQDRRVDRRRFR
ncbi:SDR family NAD(P)-dependent oxidoreductase [Nocardia fusca]|uniref:SDR family NAD(P)-dependent oxidoreductase n=1 Tax=Nocardia fusca TaxID=941183 RepID=UPI0037C8B3CD